MPFFTDQTGRSLEIPSSPSRIISVVPSQTELLYALGLGDRVTGITKFCIHPPEWFRMKTKVGGTKTLHFPIIDELKPDLIIANKEENTRDQIETLAKKYPVWISDIYNLDTALDMVNLIGEITGKQQEALNITKQILRGFEELQEYIQPLQAPLNTAYLIWNKPYMVAGGDTFINDMLGRCGFKNIYIDAKRYPETTSDELQQLNCELVLLSSEPYPFKEVHVEVFKKALPSAKILIVDGEMFSWYGSRLIKAVVYFKGLRAEVYGL